MRIEKHKLTLILSCLWLLFSIPMSEQLYANVLDERGFFMRIFALAVIAAPVWLFYGWRWATDREEIPRGYWLTIAAIGGLLFIVFATDSSRYSSWQQISYIPLIGSMMFLALVWVSNRDAPFQDDLKGRALSNLPHNNDRLARLAALNAKNQPLLALTEDLSSQFLGQLHALGGCSEPLINPKADALKAAYGLIHLNYAKLAFSERNILIFGMYRSHIITNLLALMTSTIPGPPGRTGINLDDKQLRGLTSNHLKVIEAKSAEVQKSLSSNVEHPFYPLYEDLRPHLHASATAQELNSAFAAKFAELNGKARKAIKQMLDENGAARAQ